VLFNACGGESIIDGFYPAEELLQPLIEFALMVFLHKDDYFTGDPTGDSILRCSLMLPTE